MKIEVKNLMRAFGNKKAVDDISFSFESGNVFGFIGPNGAGKTTTIKIMATLDMPTSGDIFFDGVSVVLDPEKIRHFIGYMPDSLPDFSDIQVCEYLDFFARAFGLKGKERHKRLAEIEEFTGLGAIRTKYLKALSKGMKQRVSLARALVHDPQVLIMDEPAAGLDPRARLELRSLLKILAQQGKAIILSSHILTELQDICDGAIIIEQGKLLSAGTIEQLLASAAQASTVTTATISADGVLVPVAAPVEALTPISIHVLRDVETLKLKLLEHPDVRNVETINSTEVKLQFHGADEAIPPFMASLFAAGLPIIGFSKHEPDLEDIFMKITTGGVQ